MATFKSTSIQELSPFHNNFTGPPPSDNIDVHQILKGTKKTWQNVMYTRGHPVPLNELNQPKTISANVRRLLDLELLY